MNGDEMSDKEEIQQKGVAAEVEDFVGPWTVESDAESPQESTEPCSADDIEEADDLVIEQSRAQDQGYDIQDIEAFAKDLDAELGERLSAIVDQDENHDEFAEEFAEDDDFREAGEDANQNADAGAAEAVDKEELNEQEEPLPYGGASSARDFIENNMSINELAGMVAPQARSFDGPGREPAPFAAAHNAQPVAHPAAHPQMAQGANGVGVLRALSMMGGAGIMGLQRMLSAGGGAVSSTVGTLSYGTAKKDFDMATQALIDATQKLDASGAGEIARQIEQSPEMSEDLSQILCQPENKLKVMGVTQALGEYQRTAKKMVEKGVGLGMDGDELLNETTAPLNRIIKAHEKLLEIIKDENDKSLLSKMDDCLSSIFSTLKNLIVRAMCAMGATEQKSGPKMGM